MKQRQKGGLPVVLAQRFTSSTLPAAARWCRRGGIPTAVAALIVIVVSCFMLLVVEGAHIASSMRFGTQGATVTVTTGPGGDTTTLFTDAAVFADRHGWALAYTEPGAPAVVTIHDPGGIFGDSSGSFHGRLAGAGASAVLMSSALPGADAHPPILPDGVLGGGIPATVVGVFSPSVKLGGVYPVVIRDDWRSNHVHSIGDGTFTFASSPGQNIDEAAAKEFFAARGIPVDTTKVATPKSGATFAKSTRGHLSVAAALFLVLGGLVLAVTFVSGEMTGSGGKNAAKVFVRRVFAGTALGTAAVLIIETFLLQAVLITSLVSVWMVTLGAALACAVVWIVITVVACLIRGTRKARRLRPIPGHN